MSFSKYEDAKSVEIFLEAMYDYFETCIEALLDENTELNSLHLKNASYSIGFNFEYTPK